MVVRKILVQVWSVLQVSHVHRLQLVHLIILIYPPFSKPVLERSFRSSTFQAASSRGQHSMTVR